VRWAYFYDIFLEVLGKIVGDLRIISKYEQDETRVLIQKAGRFILKLTCLEIKSLRMLLRFWEVPGSNTFSIRALLTNVYGSFSLSIPTYVR
jgi:hypothetical protein